jgi:hypothetical protein
MRTRHRKSSSFRALAAAALATGGLTVLSSAPAFALPAEQVFAEPGNFEWVVPAGVDTIQLRVYGAQGGGSLGGFGAIVTGVVHVEPGEIISGTIGAQGVRNAGGYPSGGWAGERSFTGDWANGYGGGGATTTWIAGVNRSGADQLVIAGAGGGQGGWSGLHGGDSGGNGGARPECAGYYEGYAVGYEGGFAPSRPGFGGARGSSACFVDEQRSQGGQLGVGGNGASFGGGGGGGWYGGGGGGGYGGGGGGSSYLGWPVTNGTIVEGGHRGNGAVKIMYDDPSAP